MFTPPRSVAAAAALLTVAGAVGSAVSFDAAAAPPRGAVAADPGPIDEWFAAEWAADGLTPAEPADELTVLRRLTLALHGTIPSLEQIRAFEADAAPGRLDRWCDRLLADRRFADYWAERLARTLVGTHAGNLVLYRRDRFAAWLSDRLHANESWDETVRAMIAADGMWTAVPAANFVTAEVENDVLDRNALAGRTVRAFLGQRIDCAQCHDHPFADWKRADFEGLAAFYGRTDFGLTGVREHLTDGDGPKEFTVQDRETLEDRVVAPAVPFAADRLPAGFDPDSADRRRALAAWVTHADNRRFGRAVGNRAWGLLFGRAWSEPVDDLPDPEPLEPGDAGDLLDRLAAVFRAGRGGAGHDLKHLIRTIARTRAFRLDSRAPHAADPRAFGELTDAGAVFPLVRLRPEQAIGAMAQAASVRTLDRDSPLFFRAIRFFREIDFVRDYGDLGGDELTGAPATVPQALLRMNGDLAGELARPNPLNAAGRLSLFAGPPPRQIEAAFLCCLTRRPTAAEAAALADYFEDANEEDPMADVYWTLFNAPEFSWNH